MEISRATCLVALLALTLSNRVFADVWDVQFHNDDTWLTENELLHGTTQTHDLGVRPGPVADQDWYLMPQKPYASYEVIVDGTSGDIGSSGLALERITPDGIKVVQTHSAAVTGSYGYSRALRWSNGFETANQFIRVSGAFCGTDCGSDDVYTIRARETTVNVARFNSSGSQITVLLIQNTTERPVVVVVYYWSQNGTLLATSALHNLATKNLSVIPLTDPVTTGLSGHITVSHDAGYGGLVVKAVALEPSTGFSFDTPGVYVPH